MTTYATDARLLTDRWLFTILQLLTPAKVYTSTMEYARHATCLTLDTSPSWLTGEGRRRLEFWYYCPPEYSYVEVLPDGKVKVSFIASKHVQKARNRAVQRFMN